MERRTIIRVVCGWCGKDMGTKEGMGVTGTTTTICEECFVRETKDAPC